MGRWNRFDFTVLALVLVAVLWFWQGTEHFIDVQDVTYDRVNSEIVIVRDTLRGPRPIYFDQEVVTESGTECSNEGNAYAQVAPQNTVRLNAVEELKPCLDAEGVRIYTEVWTGYLFDTIPLRSVTHTFILE